MGAHPGIGLLDYKNNGEIVVELTRLRCAHQVPFGLTSENLRLSIRVLVIDQERPLLSPKGKASQWHFGSPSPWHWWYHAR